MHNGKHNHPCQDCGRQCVDSFAHDLVSDETRSLMERLLRERLSLREMCRAVGLGLTWRLAFLVTQCSASWPAQRTTSSDVTTPYDNAFPV